MRTFLLLTCTLMFSCGTPILDVQPGVICESRCLNSELCSVGDHCNDDCGTVQFEYSLTSNCMDTCMDDLRSDNVLDFAREMEKKCRSKTSCGYLSCIGSFGEPIECNNYNDRIKTIAYSPLVLHFCDKTK